MKKIKVLLLIALVLIVGLQNADAQRFTKKKQYWSIGGSINSMNYVGDITSSYSKFSVPLKFSKYNLGFSATKRLKPRISVRGNAFVGRMKSDDREFGSASAAASGKDYGRWQRGASFVNTVYEVSGTVIIDFFENRGTFQKRPDYTPYAFVGLGAFYHNPKDAHTRQTFKSLPWGDFSNFQAALLYGLGFRYKLDKQWDLAIEIGWRNTTTDMLDGVRGEYWENTDTWSATDREIYDKTAIGTDIPLINGHEYTTISRPAEGEFASLRDAQKNGATRGDTPNDGYIVTGIHLTKILGGKVICPKFR